MVGLGQEVSTLEVVHHQEVRLELALSGGEEVLQDLDLSDRPPGRTLLQLSPPPPPVPGDGDQLQEQRVHGHRGGCSY